MQCFLFPILIASKRVMEQYSNRSRQLLMQPVVVIADSFERDWHDSDNHTTIAMAFNYLCWLCQAKFYYKMALKRYLHTATFLFFLSFNVLGRTHSRSSKIIVGYLMLACESWLESESAKCLPTPAPTPTPVKKVDSDRHRLRSRLRLRSPVLALMEAEIFISFPSLLGINTKHVRLPTSNTETGWKTRPFCFLL